MDSRKVAAQDRIYLTDTHCHIHDPKFFENTRGEEACRQAIDNNVTKLLLVGTDLLSSEQAIAFAGKFPENCWVSVGIHPHEAAKLSDKQITSQLQKIAALAQNPKVVAIGECGFDFYYNDRANLARQTKLLEGQLAIAQKLSLPVCFHVREGFDDFWPVFDRFKGLKGVLHSFTGRSNNLSKALKRGLFIGINGIATFTAHRWQQQLYQAVPLSNLLLETDSPFLTPVPYRGTINTPKNVSYITSYLAELRGEDRQKLAFATTNNAIKLFGLNNGYKLLRTTT